jgi:hypothetical protein
MAQENGERPADEQGSEWIRAALARWAEFPVDADPRPLVLVGPSIQPREGFTKGGAKLAFLEGRIAVGGDVPESVLEAIRRRGADHVNATPHVHEDLVLIGAERSSATFRTDRGLAELPAWRVTGPEVRAGIYVLDPEITERFWTPAPVEPSSGRQPPHMHIDASVGEDDCTLIVRFVGGPPDVAEYDSVVFEDDRAVLVLPRERPRAAPAQIVHTMMGYRREVEVRLQSPLEARVVVDLRGDALTVERESN